ncbi:hypothetical protein GW17_00005040 [Ensete ventricosum]|nr:hypothetical protein GW17_00005040 [Ensete ventricosum]
MNLTLSSLGHAAHHEPPALPGVVCTRRNPFPAFIYAAPPPRVAAADLIATMQAGKNAMASVKETAENVAASATSGMDKTKATVQEKNKHRRVSWFNDDTSFDCPYRALNDQDDRVPVDHV